MNIVDFLDCERTLAAPLLKKAQYPWDALDMLSEYVLRLGRTLDTELYEEVKTGVWVARSAAVSDSAQLTAPIIICEGAEVGNSSILRGPLIIGKGAFVGNSCEIQKSLVFDFARAPHYNYVSDSILGYRSVLGAGAIISNMRADRGEVVCNFGNISIGSGRKRFGAIVGDKADVGCSSVISAGSVLEPGSRVNPLTRVRGFVSAGRIYKGESIISDILI
jgi:NDP-sugar pyrophosphorylase family protein